MFNLQKQKHCIKETNSDICLITQIKITEKWDFFKPYAFMNCLFLMLDLLWEIMQFSREFLKLIFWKNFPNYCFKGNALLLFYYYYCYFIVILLLLNYYYYKGNECPCLSINIFIKFKRHLFFWLILDTCQIAKYTEQWIK